MDSPESRSACYGQINGDGIIRGKEVCQRSSTKKLISEVASNSGYEVCCGCHEAISDRYIMRVMDNSWHESCLQCHICRIILTRTCYSRDCKLYCKTDYDKLFATKCAGCHEPIPPTDLVMRALDNVYHLNCFQCVICGHQLEKGDQFVIRSGKLFCRPDFEKEMSLLQLQSSQTSESALVPSSNSQNSPISSSNNSSSAASVTNLTCPRQDGRRGPKRPRTILTTAQRRAFKASFEISQKPCRKVRESLAKETGLSVRIVQVWFQNQRAKLKKIQRKQQQLQSQQSSGQAGGGGDTNGQSSDKSNGDKLSPFSRLGRVSSGHLSDSSADSTGYTMSHMQYLTHSPDGSYYSNHEDGYSKGEIGMDSESSLNGLDDVVDIGHSNHVSDEVSLHRHPHQVGGNHHNGHTSAPATIFDTSMTPIDKLYSMQTSYFSSSTECECLGASN